MSSEHALNDQVYEAEGRPVSMADLLSYFNRMGAMRVSDLHVKIGCPPTYRKDGNLQPIKGDALSVATVKALVHAMLSDKEVATLQEKRSIDSSLITDDFQFRLNVFYDNDGLAAAIRALESDVPPVENLGFPNAVWKDIVNMQQGLVLLTGITGAGKSTTIASLLAYISATRRCRIITLEDPIEYRLHSRQAMVSQREVGRDVPTFERGLRDALREDPDVIFVGEMRDRESTRWTLTAAETGHLVFSTLHTRDTRGSITRLLDMFPANQQDEIACQVSLGLKYCIAQKLLPRADEKGRVVAMEILNNTYSVSNLIRLRKLEQLYSQLQIRTRDIPEERMITMERSLARLVRAQIVTAQEAEKWAEDRSAFLDELKQVR
jgi:twitching motility protein PilT